MWSISSKWRRCPSLGAICFGARPALNVSNVGNILSANLSSSRLHRLGPSLIFFVAILRTDHLNVSLNVELVESVPSLTLQVLKKLMTAPSNQKEGHANKVRFAML